jgi:hypothetical protein
LAETPYVEIYVIATSGASEEIDRPSPGDPPWNVSAGDQVRRGVWVKTTPPFAQ